MTTPTGTPAWEHQSDASTYGGHPQKRNYQAQGSVNPRTDLSAEEFLRLAVDVAALQRVAPFCHMRVLCKDAVPAAPTIQHIRQMTAVSTSGYEGDAPSDVSFPTVTRISDGRIRALWPESALDEFGVSGAISLALFEASVVNAGAFASVRIVPVSAVEVDFEALDAAGSPVADAIIVLEVS